MKQCTLCGKTYADDVSACPLDGARLSAAQREDSLLGEVIKGRYRVVRKLGEGGMGSVYLAEQLSISRRVALKVLHREFARDREFVQRFHQEAKLAASLNDPRITTVFDFDQGEDGSLFIVMEYLEGKLLSDVIRREGAMDIGGAIRLAIQIAEGLTAAHAAGVIHRDIKPQNIMVLIPGDGVKLMDFGIARLGDTQEVKLTRAGALMGTPSYMAPEQIEGRSVSARTDIYAFGIVLYEMLTGTTPFNAPTSTAVLAKQLREPPPPLRGVRPEVPPLVEQVVMQALEKEPEWRQESMADVARRLRAAGGFPAQPQPATGPAGVTMVSSSSAGVDPATTAPTVVAAPTRVSTTPLASQTMVAPAGEAKSAPAWRTGPRWMVPAAIALVVLLVAGATAVAVYRSGYPASTPTQTVASQTLPKVPRVEPPTVSLPSPPDSASPPPLVMSVPGERPEQVRPALPPSVRPKGPHRSGGMTSDNTAADSSKVATAVRLSAPPRQPVKIGDATPAERPSASPPRQAVKVEGVTPAEPPSANPNAPHLSDDTKGADSAKVATAVSPSVPPRQPAKIEEATPAEPINRNPVAIRTALEAKLRAAGFLRRHDSDDFGVTIEGVSSDGVVKLTGVVRNRDEREAVIRLAHSVQGVTKVSPRLNVPWTSN